MEIRNLCPTIATEITGVDLTTEISKEVRQQLYDLWVDRAVLVFRAQTLTPAQFYHAAELFGSVMNQQVGKFSLSDFPMIGTISSRDLPIIDGKLHVRGENYHTDHSNYVRPPKATMLYAVSLPSKGGDTQFVDVRAAYDDLPAPMRREISALRSLHVYESSESPRKMAALTPEELAKIPTTSQPLVIRHADSGRGALYLNTARMEGIEGMDRKEASALIATLFDHATRSKYEYRHVWQKGDVVIWDNRSVMHQANADFDPTELRYLYRVMVEGDALTPYEEPAASAANI